MLLIDVEDEYPQFGKLQGIYVVEGNRVLLRLRLCTTQLFDHHHHSFIISTTPTYKVVSVEELYNPVPLHVRTIYSENAVQQVVVMKYHICGTLKA